jgi:hypothetical protein
MIPLALIVLNKLGDRSPKMAFPDRNQPIQTLFFDRPHESLRVRIGIRGADGR